MALYITNVFAGNLIFERGVFTSKEKAFKHAISQSKEKVWKMDKNTFFTGNVNVAVYEINNCESSQYVDSPIKIF